MILAFITGEIELPPRHAAFPDIAMMVDDIDRATRELHDGWLVRCVSNRRGPNLRIHVGQFVPHASGGPTR